jgi:hypothetical protein
MSVTSQEITAAVREHLVLARRTDGRIVPKGVDRVYDSLGVDPRRYLTDPAVQETCDYVHSLVQSAVHHAEAS